MLGRVGLPEILVILAMVALAATYFIPTFIAYSRRHVNRGAILLLNLLLGWTFLGWVGALIWSATSNVETRHQPTFPPAHV